MTQGKLICLLGKSGSGKSTIEAMLEKEHGFYRTISTTTRPMREGEEQGVTYNYVCTDEFKEMLENGDVLEHTEYNNWLYCLTKESVDLSKGHHVAVIEKHGYEQLVENFGRENIVSFLINVDDKERLIRALTREERPNCKEICRRFLNDAIDFEGLEEQVDHVINNISLDVAVGRIAYIIKDCG